MRNRRPAADDRPAEDLFRSRLENQIDLRHPLARLTAAMPWSALEQALSANLPADPVRGGRPALPIRLMAGLLYLKHAYDLSDEAVCERWLENPYWQFFTGEVFFQTTLPCDPSSLTRWRQRLGEAGMEELLAQTINAAKAMKAVDARELSRVAAGPQVAIVDLGYRGREVECIQILHPGKATSLTRRQCRWIKRRQAVEPVIGHLKQEHRLDRCWLKGTEGDAGNAVLSAAGYNLRWLMRWIALLRAWLRVIMPRPMATSPAVVAVVIR